MTVRIYESNATQTVNDLYSHLYDAHYLTAESSCILVRFTLTGWMSWLMTAVAIVKMIRYEEIIDIADGS